MAVLEIGNVVGEVICRAGYTVLLCGNNPTQLCIAEGA